MGPSGKSGKTLTFILIVFLVLFFSVTVIAGFLLLKEIDKSQAAQIKIDQLQALESKLNADLKAAQEQITLLDEKKKEAESLIENLQGEVDLQKTAKEEVQKRNQELEDNLQKEVQAKEDIRSRLSQDLKAAQDKYNSIKSELDQVVVRNKELEEAKAQVEEKIQTNPDVELGKIIVNPNPASNGKGKVISVDSDTDFVIVSLGERDGIVKGALLSIYRADQYLGDVKVSRVLAEMSAADFVPPFKSQSVKKDDQVVPKK